MQKDSSHEFSNTISFKVKELCIATQGNYLGNVVKEGRIKGVLLACVGIKNGAKRFNSVQKASCLKQNQKWE